MKRTKANVCLFWYVLCGCDPECVLSVFRVPICLDFCVEEAGCVLETAWLLVWCQYIPARHSPVIHQS